MDFEKKINFIIFKIHSSKKLAIADPEKHIKYILGPDGEPVEDPTQSNEIKMNPQTVLVSATLSKGIKEIARRLNLNDAVTLDASETVMDLKKNMSDDEEENDGKISLPSGLTHYYMSVPSKLRLIALLSFIMGKITVSEFNLTSKFCSWKIFIRFKMLVSNNSEAN